MVPIEQARSLSIQQVAKRLGVSTRTVWNFIGRGDLRKFNLSPRLARIPIEDVERLEHL